MMLLCRCRHRCRVINVQSNGERIDGRWPEHIGWGGGAISTVGVMGRGTWNVSKTTHSELVNAAHPHPQRAGRTTVFQYNLRADHIVVPN